MNQPISYYREKLLEMGSGKPTIYQPLEHPEFEGWEVHQPCRERLQMIEDQLTLTEPGRLLDLGCHTGWFCRRFAERGWQVTGVDRSPFYLDVASDLMKGYPEEGPPIRYVRADLEHYPIPTADVALCLSTLMYLFPAGLSAVDRLQSDQVAWEFLRWLSRSCPILFADWGGDYAGGIPEHFPDLIIQHTEYDTATLIGHSDHQNRPLWMFQRGGPRLTWVMGGTAVGKKHYIERSDDYPLWFHDGEVPFEELLAEIHEGMKLRGGVVARWQWGREQAIVRLKDDPSVKQRILLLYCDPEVQAERARQREGHEEWDASVLMGEAREVESLALQLSARLAIPFEREYVYGSPIS